MVGMWTYWEKTVNRRNDEKRKITEEVYDKVREDRELA